MLLNAFVVLVLLLAPASSSQFLVSTPPQSDFTLQSGQATTERISLASDGTQGDSYSFNSSISADGRYVAFESIATNLGSGNTSQKGDIFVRDRQTGQTEWISPSPSGSFGDGISAGPCISADGRYVVFESDATNLVSGDINGRRDIFLRDRQTDLTELISLTSTGTQSNNDSTESCVSADGRYVVYQSLATNLIPGDTNNANDLFLRDRQTGLTELISQTPGGTYSNDSSSRPIISEDGRFVVFDFAATDLVSIDINGKRDIFLRDRQIHTTEIISLNSEETQSNNSSMSSTLSADGRYVVFGSSASNLIPGDFNNSNDIYLRDRLTGQTGLISQSSDGTQGNSDSWSPSISADGRFISFGSTATNLVTADINGENDIFLYDRQAGLTKLISQSSDGTRGNSYSRSPSISAHGRFVVFYSASTNLVPADTNEVDDVFLRDLWGGSSNSLFLPVIIR